MSIEQANFREVLSQLATGVSILTVKYGSLCHGITVNSFCSLSLEPPLILVCIREDSFCLNLIEKGRTFGINILDETGEDLSRQFASRTASKFTNVSYRLSREGIPILNTALATIECRLVNRYPGGDHSIIVGEVLNAEVDHYSQPLVYFRRGYTRLSAELLNFVG
jgi:flavin reductase (DIM6/NTAB) family NADH-FMN oxidoreductase RutF